MTDDFLTVFAKGVSTTLKIANIIDFYKNHYILTIVKEILKYDGEVSEE